MVPLVKKLLFLGFRLRFRFRFHNTSHGWAWWALPTLLISPASALGEELRTQARCTFCLSPWLYSFCCYLRQRSTKNRHPKAAQLYIYTIFMKFWTKATCSISKVVDYILYIQFVVHIFLVAKIYCTSVTTQFIWLFLFLFAEPPRTSKTFYVLWRAYIYNSINLIVAGVVSVVQHTLHTVHCMWVSYMEPLQGPCTGFVRRIWDVKIWILT